jgi:methionyl aminopeptidase
MARIIYKSPRDLEKMRAAGYVVSKVLATLRDAVRPGVSTHELDQIALEMIRAHGGTPSFLGYHGYPASICSSLNEEVVHGIPSPKVVLKDGDVIKLDVGVKLKGFHADCAISVPVGKVPDDHRKLLEVTRESLWKGIQAVTLRGRLQDVSRAIQQHVEKHGYSIVREMVGHGVGKQLHEPPQIPNYVDAQHENPQLLEGMTLAIEPMVNLGDAEIETLEDQWTVVATDGKLSAHFEHTVAVARGGADVLTLGPHDSGP